MSIRKQIARFFTPGASIVEKMKSNQKEITAELQSLRTEINETYEKKTRKRIDELERKVHKLLEYEEPNHHLILGENGNGKAIDIRDFQSPESD